MDKQTFDPKSARNIFISLFIWIISMSGIFVSLLIVCGNRDLPVSKRVALPIIALISKYTDSKSLTAYYKKSEQAAWKERGLQEKNTLDAEKVSLDNFVHNADTLKRLAVVTKLEDDIDEGYARYNEAMEIIARWERGENFKSRKVLDVTENLASLNKKLQHELLVTPSFYQDFSAELKGKILKKCLLDIGKAYEYKVDSIGLKKDKSGANAALVINGFRQYTPNKIHLTPETFMSELKFSQKLDPQQHNLIVMFLKSDKKDVEVYYGNKKAMGFKSSKYRQIFNNNTGLNVEISFPGIWQTNISCNPLSSWTSDGMETIVVDMREQKWCKWSTTVSNLSAEVLTKIEAQKNFTVSSPLRRESLNRQR